MGPSACQIGIFRPVDIASFNVKAVEPQQRRLFAVDVRRHDDDHALIRVVLNVAVPQFMPDDERHGPGLEFRLPRCLHHVEFSS